MVPTAQTFGFAAFSCLNITLNGIYLSFGQKQDVTSSSGKSYIVDLMLTKQLIKKITGRLIN